MESHLLQMRGLKPADCRLVGVRTESHLLQMRGLKPNESEENLFAVKSHLLQMRGLKRHVLTPKDFRQMSHLLQMRGLKPLLKYRYRTGTNVASFTDAWIETQRSVNNIGSITVASFTDAWIETICTTQASCGTVSRIFYRCVD